jgi:hypothetical protein
MQIWIGTVAETVRSPCPNEVKAWLASLRKSFVYHIVPRVSQRVRDIKESEVVGRERGEFARPQELLWEEQWERG